MSLYTIKERCENIMTNIYETRDDDKLLYYHVCKEIGLENGINVDSLSFKAVMTNPNMTFPSTESVRRCRQKLQEENHNLWGDKREIRMQHCEDYKNFALDGKITED